MARAAPYVLLSFLLALLAQPIEQTFLRSGSIKLLTTIRFDASDVHVFDDAAEPGEWAVPGAFSFTQLNESDLTGKTKQAFANGFLGLGSFGRSTFVTVREADETDEAQNPEALAHMLAAHFVERYGAPDLAAALPVAREEIGYVVELCREVPVNTVFAVQRRIGDDGKIHEEFRKVDAPSAEPDHTKIWKIVDDDA